MTILQALAARYDYLAAEGRAPVRGFGPARISFTIVLATDGHVVGVDDLRTKEGQKLRPSIVPAAPQLPKRTAAIASGAFWDKTSYALGRTAIDLQASPVRRARDFERLAKEQAAFIARHEALLSGKSDISCLALLRFLRTWHPDAYDALPHAEAMLDQNVAFRLEGEAGFIYDCAAAREALQSEASTGGTATTGVCLVTGEIKPVARLHPSIKNVPGAQASGAALVSFNLEAFNSYGKTQGGNAPVSEAVAFGYANALNALLAPAGTDERGRAIYRNRVRLGQVTMVFWAETTEAEDIARAFLVSPPLDEANGNHALRHAMKDMETGKPPREAMPKIDPATRVYVLGLSANAARLSVRFWIEQSVGELAMRLIEHWADLRIDPLPRIWPPATRVLLLELSAAGEGEGIPDHLNGEVTRAILTGSPYPRSLLAHTLMRIRADGRVSPLRVALVKAVLARAVRKTTSDWKDTFVALDRDETNIGYLLGRLFALLAYAQYLSVGSVKAGVKEKFFASASATPARVFPSLLRNSQYYLSDARRSPATERGAGWTDAEMKQVMDGLAADRPFPATLSFDDQGRFVVGYYHQRSASRGSGKPDADDSSIDRDD